MRQIRYVAGHRPGNVLIQAVGIIAGLIVIAIAAVIGGIVLAVGIGLALIAWLVIYVRFWWLGRRAEKDGYGERVVEAEYRVVETTTTDEDPR